MNEYRYDCIMALCEKEWNSRLGESKGSWHNQTMRTKNNFFNMICKELESGECA